MLYDSVMMAQKLRIKTDNETLANRIEETVPNITVGRLHRLANEFNLDPSKLIDEFEQKTIIERQWSKEEIISTFVLQFFDFEQAVNKTKGAGMFADFSSVAAKIETSSKFRFNLHRFQQFWAFVPAFYFVEWSHDGCSIKIGMKRNPTDTTPAAEALQSQTLVSRRNQFEEAVKQSPEFKDMQPMMLSECFPLL